jgi:hypothetical protein
MLQDKNQIDYHFFENLDEKVAWFYDFKNIEITWFITSVFCKLIQNQR